MAQKTSGEFEKEFIDNLKSETGKDLGAWMKTIGGFEISNRNKIIARLKAEHGFGHMNASLLAGIYGNNGKLVYQDTAELLEAQFAKAEQMKPLFDKLIEFAKETIPSAQMLPKKTYVSILDNREFAAVNIKPKELRVGLDLGDRTFDNRIEKAKLSGPMPRISHMFVLTDAVQLDPEIAAALKESYGRCH